MTLAFATPQVMSCSVRMLNLGMSPPSDAAFAEDPMATTSRPAHDTRKLQALGLVASLGCTFLVGACGRKEPSPAAPQPQPAPPPVAAEATPPAPPPPPELGVPLGAFVSARVLDLCAQKYGEKPQKGQRLAVASLLGHKPEWHLEQALQPPAPAVKSDAKAAAKAKPEPIEVAPPESDAERKARETYVKAIPLAESHTPTQQQVAKQVQQCLYAPELGIIEQDLIDRYVKVFVEIACLQREMADAAGKLDEMAHAQAAARAFTENQFNAADFAKIGVVFGRFPVIQAQVQDKKNLRCPDPRVAAAAAVATGEWNGSLAGDRNAVLRVAAHEGQLTGSVQWLGVPAKAADGQPGTQPALPVTGVLSGQTVSLFGQVGNDWVRLSGKFDGPVGKAPAKSGTKAPAGALAAGSMLAAARSISGTWQGEVDMHKFKGTWKAERLQALAPKLALPGSPTPAAAP